MGHPVAVLRPILSTGCISSYWDLAQNSLWCSILLFLLKLLKHIEDDSENYRIVTYRAGKSCTRCTRCVRTFCSESRTFEDILGLWSRTFVAILEQELRIGNSRLRIRMRIWLRMRIEEVLRMMIRIRIEDWDWGSRIEDWGLRIKDWGSIEDEDWGWA